MGLPGLISKGATLAHFMDVSDSHVRELFIGIAKELAMPTYDYILAGDGSGTTAEKPCGFACLAYDRRSEAVFKFYGDLSHGTNNFAELFPYVHALWHHYGRNELKQPTVVRIISDSELTVRCGNGIYARNANGCLWSAIEFFERQGYSIYWNHIYRLSNELNKLCDKQANNRRADAGCHYIY